MACATTRIEQYKDVSGAFRWRLLARNGKTIADSAEGYDSAGNLTKAVDRFISATKGGLYAVVFHKSMKKG